MLDAGLQKADGSLYTETFLVDTGSDTTILSASVLNNLRFPTRPAPGGVALIGLGGRSHYVVIDTILELFPERALPLRYQGSYDAITDPAALEYSLLGRDILDFFDVIVSERRGEVLLVTGLSKYDVVAP